MNQPAITISSSLLIRQFTIRDSYPLPLARARNHAAAQARYDQLIFLDVDCIPGHMACVQLLEQLRPGRLLMANPSYLPQPIGPLDDQLYKQLPELARLNSLRSDLAFGKSGNFNMFWSLGFAMYASTFQTVGGFDETFTGYGAEDTDFAYMCRDHSVDLYFANAPIYHQYHESYNPPLNHLSDIAYNAKVFYDKWHEWPMSGWLKAFQKDGYINWTDRDINILRLPTATEIAATLN